MMTAEKLIDELEEYYEVYDFKIFRRGHLETQKIVVEFNSFVEIDGMVRSAHAFFGHEWRVMGIVLPIIDADESNTGNLLQLRYGIVFTRTV